MNTNNKKFEVNIKTDIKANMKKNSKSKLNIDSIRNDFPILSKKIREKNLIYLDNAATTLKPSQVVQRISDHYLYETSNVHRGLHYLSDQATENFEHARGKIANFINANDDEVIFTKGTTDSINTVARSFCSSMKSGEGILISELEHHSNIVPWQTACERFSLKLHIFKVLDDGSPDLEDYESKLKSNVKLVAMTFVSNSLGVIFPVEEMTKMAHASGAKVLIDGAQAMAHQKVDVKALNCDFFVCSSHKIFGPTGMGLLYGKSAILNDMPPFEVGGGMIDKVSFEGTTFLKAPFRFEAGTPHIAGAIGFGAAIDYLSQFSMDEIYSYETSLTQYAQNLLSDIPEVRVFGKSKHKGPIISFVVEGENSSDIGSLLDNDGIAVRAGHHCTQPLMRKLGVSGTIRASFAMYNTTEEIDVFYNSLKKVIKILKA